MYNLVYLCSGIASKLLDCTFILRLVQMWSHVVRLESGCLKRCRPEHSDCFKPKVSSAHDGVNITILCQPYILVTEGLKLYKAQDGHVNIIYHTYPLAIVATCCLMVHSAGILWAGCLSRAASVLSICQQHSPLMACRWQDRKGNILVPQFINMTL